MQQGEVPARAFSEAAKRIAWPIIASTATMLSVFAPLLIVSIDTYNNLRWSGQGVTEAALRTGAQRLRPVLLTSITTALGLMRMTPGKNQDFVTHSIAFEAPFTAFGTELSSTITGGLVITILFTLVVTPAMLILSDRSDLAQQAARS